MSEQFEYDNNPNIICLNDAVLLHSNRKGVVRYISDKTQDRIVVGIELTEPNPSQPADVGKLFKCKPNHGILIPLTQIARKIMPEELLIQLQYLTNKVRKYHAQAESLRHKIVENENQTCCWITNQFMSPNNIKQQQQSRHRRHRHKDRDRHREYGPHRNGTGHKASYTQEKKDRNESKEKKRTTTHAIKYISSDAHVSLPPYIEPNTLSMSLHLENKNGFQAMTRQYEGKDKAHPMNSAAKTMQVTSSNQKQPNTQMNPVGSASKSTDISPTQHPKHVHIKGTDIAMSTDETFSNPSVETVDSHIGDAINSNGSSNHIT